MKISMDFFEMKEKQYISHKGNIHVSVCLFITSPVHMCYLYYPKSSIAFIGRETYQNTV
jgi:hypothetical protein